MTAILPWDEEHDPLAWLHQHRKVGFDQAPNIVFLQNKRFGVRHKLFYFFWHQIQLCHRHILVVWIFNGEGDVVADQETSRFVPIPVQASVSKPEDGEWLSLKDEL